MFCKYGLKLGGKRGGKGGGFFPVLRKSLLLDTSKQNANRFQMWLPLSYVASERSAGLPGWEGN